MTTALEWAHPIVREWFARRFGEPSEPQAAGWPHIHRGASTLICAPTGSGKTLAAFLACIDRLVRKGLAGELEDRTEVVYVSPLKALSNDIQKNLEAPLAEIVELAGQRGLLLPPIRTAVRTGDTHAHARREMLRRPPHILVTTPESLYILLTASKSRENLRAVETVIVDEIHAVADDKRGSHLALSLERLDALTSRPPVRIGLSATQKPIELIAAFLTGGSRPSPEVVEVGHARQLDIAIEVPRSPLGAVATHEEWGEIYNRLAELAGQHRSTLVFVNTRRLAERVAHNLAERLGDEAVATHHGSLARSLRLAAERKLKAGEIKVLVATASLELGIDIGSVDLVCQIGSPRSISVAWQRIGRAGHWRGAIPKGRIFATTRNELLECAALVRAIRCGDLDSIDIPEAPLDILAQQIVACCAADDWKEDELFALVCRAFPYRNLVRTDFDAVLEMLSNGMGTARGRYGAYLHRDRVNGWVRGRRGARLAAITSGGAIPDNALYTVVAEPDGAVVGTVDEDFAVESLAGDVMLLGNTSWRIRRVQASKVIVEDAHGAAPNIPFWRGEAPARTNELSRHVSELRRELDQRTKELQHRPEVLAGNAGHQVIEWLRSECCLDQAGAEQILEYVLAGREILGCVPTQDTVVAERFFDEGGGMQLILHAPFGGRINKAWGLALRKRFCRTFNLELQAAATDDGINISLGERHSFPLADVFRFLHESSVEEVLKQAVLPSPIFGARWRWDASRSLALLRFQGGKKVPPNIQRMRADDLLSAVFPDAAACPENLDGPTHIPDHPLVREAMKDALTEAMDLQGLREVIAKIRSGDIQCVAVDTPVPSQFSHEILNANPYAFLDDAPLEERRARAVEMRRVLPETVLSEIGRLDPAAIATVREQAWPDVRNAAELHDALLTFVVFPEPPAAQPPDSRAFEHSDGFLRLDPIEHAIATSASQWKDFFEKLLAENRVRRFEIQNRAYWVAAERLTEVRHIFHLDAGDTPQTLQTASTKQTALIAAVTGWLQSSGPLQASRLATWLGCAASDISNALLAIEASGAALRGQFEPAASNETQWCDRRLLARIHRLTVETLRKEIEPVTAAKFMAWLSHWQHVAPGSQLRGELGLLEALRQLQGFEAPANTWERNILSKRVAEYDPASLDMLCLTGRVAWGRLSPHPAFSDADRSGDRRIMPTSVAPITFFLREEADWLPAASSGRVNAESTPLSNSARDVLQFLSQRGASFFSEIVRGAKRLKSEVEAALWELVAAGAVTADSFDNLRAMLDPKRRAGAGRARAQRPRDAGGRWSLLLPNHDAPASQNLEPLCRVLLNRYGVVFRELLTRESAAPSWREVVRALRRLEDRGEIRGGRFVSGVLSEQFALPIAVESLRAFRSRAAEGEEFSVAASDPLNLVGIIIPGEKVPANSGRSIAFRDGIPRPAEPATNADAA